MTEVPFEAKCPTCGFQFHGGTLMNGKNTLKDANGVCCACGEVLHIGPDLSLRPLLAREYIALNANDSLSIIVLVSQVNDRIRREKALKN